MLPETTKAVVLLDDETYTVDARGQAVEHVRRVVKILRPQGRDDAYPVVWFDKDSKILSLHAWSIDPAGHEYAVKDNEMFEGSPPGEGNNQYYEDIKFKVANPPGRDPGGIVAYEYERRERPYLSEADWQFQDDLPRITQSFTLVLPPGYTYSTTWAHHPKVDAIDLEHQRYRWEMNNEPAIDPRPRAHASAESLIGRMTCSNTAACPSLAFPEDGTRRGIGQWYTALSHDPASPRILDITAKRRARAHLRQRNRLL